MPIQKHLKGILFLTVYPALLLILNACSGAAYTNDLNGGFEEYSLGSENPYGWASNNFQSANRNVIFSVDRHTAHSGNYSVSIEIPLSAPSQKKIFNWVTRIENIKEGIYELSGWIKIKRVSVTPYIEIQFYGLEGNRMITGYNTREMFSLTGTNNWKKVSAIFKVPVGTSKTVIKAVLESYGNNGGKVWFDDLKLAKIRDN